MFKFVGKLTRLGYDSTIYTLKGVLNIPGDIVEGYKEGFNSSEEKAKTVVENPKTVEVKTVRTRKKAPKTVAKTTTTARVRKTPVAKTTKSVSTKKTATTKAKVTKAT